MYRKITVEDKVRVDPNKFDRCLEDAVKASLQEKWEGITDRSLGVILGVVSVQAVGEGKILPGDGAIFYPVTFTLLAYRPELNEVVVGDVIDVTEFGAFVRIGPVDGMIHVSQIMDDFVSFDQKSMAFSGRESKRIIRNGDIVRSRIISVSIEREFKIGLTTRQAGLGVLSWIEKSKKDKAAPEKPAKAPAKAPAKRGKA
ncbi:MAG: DNA-directed RNA polymerase [Candidatus Aenigmatarchaeota archaeon]